MILLTLARKLQRQGMEHDVSKEGHRTASHHRVAIDAGVARLAVGFEDHLPRMSRGGHLYYPLVMTNSLLLKMAI